MQHAYTASLVSCSDLMPLSEYRAQTGFAYKMFIAISLVLYGVPLKYRVTRNLRLQINFLTRKILNMSEELCIATSTKYEFVDVGIFTVVGMLDMNYIIMKFLL